MNSYLVCYDISDDRERTRVFRLLKKHGQPVQESVFELHRFSATRYQRLHADLARIVSDPHSVRLYRLTQDAIADSRDLAGQPIARRPLFIIL